MVTNRELLHRVWAMQAIWEFDILRINDLPEITCWMSAVEHSSHPVNTPDVALIEWSPDMPAKANEYFLQEVRHTPQLARLPVIVLCDSELGDTERDRLGKCYGVNAVISKTLLKLFEINRLIAEACQTVKSG